MHSLTLTHAVLTHAVLTHAVRMHAVRTQSLYLYHKTIQMLATLSQIIHHLEIHTEMLAVSIQMKTTLHNTYTETFKRKQHCTTHTPKHSDENNIAQHIHQNIQMKMFNENLII
jgi:hypothetical protein